MKWAHLPNPGGLYNQDPELLNKFEIIFQKIAEHEAKEAKKREDEAARETKRSRAASAARHGRQTRIRN